MKLVTKAEQFARQAHKEQKQTTGKPYFEHPQEVARLLENWEQDDEVIIAGYLHDVVEDGDISLKEIEKRFGKRVAYLVDGMSWVRDKKTKKKDLDATYKKFANSAKKEPKLILIKLADMTSNLPNIKANYLKQKEWFINKSYLINMGFYIPFMKAVGLNKGTEKIVGEFHKHVRKRIKSVLYDYISKEDLKKIKDKLK